MARRSSGLRAIVGIVKIIDRAGKQAERDKQRRISEQERERQRLRREAERDADKQAKVRKRAAEQAVRDSSKSKAQAIKDEWQAAKECFEYRIEERRAVKEEIINEFMR
jgi:hypothetical protein